MKQLSILSLCSLLLLIPACGRWGNRGCCPSPCAPICAPACATDCGTACDNGGCDLAEGAYYDGAEGEDRYDQEYDAEAK